MADLYHLYKSTRRWAKAATTKIPREGQHVVIKTRKGYLEGVLFCYDIPCVSDIEAWGIQTAEDVSIPLSHARVAFWLRTYESNVACSAGMYMSRRIAHPDYTPALSSRSK